MGDHLDKVGVSDRQWLHAENFFPGSKKNEIKEEKMARGGRRAGAGRKPKHDFRGIANELAQRMQALPIGPGRTALCLAGHGATDEEIAASILPARLDSVRDYILTGRAILEASCIRLIFEKARGGNAQCIISLDRRLRSAN
jgi:hypothetical protein